MLAEYVGELVVIRYLPSDITSIRIYYKGKF
ncbi:Mu transposase C-terminal domain-containing protein [Candidatus Tisiphia endosymbiont of Temnostethus pusillus]